jgi:ABC-type multidrug transport system fused ATPase/permease subunit
MRLFSKIAATAHSTTKLIRIMLKYDKLYFVYIILDIITYALITFANLFLVQQSVAMLETKEEFTNFFLVVVGFLLASMLLNCLHSFFNYKRDLHGSTISVALMESIFEKTLKLDYELLLDKDIQEKRRFATQITQNNKFVNLSNTFYGFFSNLIVLIGLIAILAQIDIWILVISMIVVIVNTKVAIHQNKFRRAIDVDLNPISRKIIYFNEIGSDFSYSKEIKNYGMIKPLVSKFFAIQNEWYEGCNKVTRNSLGGFCVSYVANFVLNAVVYVYLGFKVLLKRSLSIANFSMFLTSILEFNGCIQSIVSFFTDISASAPYLQDYFDFMNLKTMNDKLDGELYRLPETGSYRITFDNVSYRYPHQELYALENISFDVKSGEKIAVVGENGAGKTTMVLLLMRLIDPTKGRIYLNGVDIRNYDENEYRTLFSTVFQDFKLFSFTIEENITALAKTEPDQVERAVEGAGLTKKVSSLSKGAKTYIDKLYDNEGVSLSGGEGQRLAISRALYKNAPIYVLDEPTAALDPLIENDIYARFRDITERKTTFYITHRLASTHFCDRIIVLKNGGIEEMGSHRELMRENGYYAELYNMQAQYYTEDIKEK